MNAQVGAKKMHLIEFIMPFLPLADGVHAVRAIERLHIHVERAKIEEKHKPQKPFENGDWSHDVGRTWPMSVFNVYV